MREQLNRYFTRTVEHIHRVQKNMVTIVTVFREVLELSDDECQHLMWSVMNHDRSKFSKKQFWPYVELTEYYHQRKVLNNPTYDYSSPIIRDAVEEAVLDHYMVENHHPERLQPLQQMTKLELIEVVCDLQAMAQEFNEGSCRGYFENVWQKKQSKFFTDDYYWESSKSLMLNVISCFEQNKKSK